MHRRSLFIMIFLLVCGQCVHPVVAEPLDVSDYVFDVEDEIAHSSAPAKSFLERIQEQVNLAHQNISFLGSVSKNIITEKISILKGFCAKKYASLSNDVRCNKEAYIITGVYSAGCFLISCYVYKKHGTRACLKSIGLEALPPLAVKLINRYGPKEVEVRTSVLYDTSKAWVCIVKDDGSLSFDSFDKAA